MLDNLKMLRALGAEALAVAEEIVDEGGNLPDANQRWTAAIRAGVITDFAMTCLGAADRLQSDFVAQAGRASDDPQEPGPLPVPVPPPPRRYIPPYPERPKR